MSATAAAPFSRVTIVGCGLVGGSVAAAAALSGGATVTITDADPDVVGRAAELGVGDRHVHELEVAVADAELVVVAVPVTHVPDIVARIAPASAPGTIITDVGSVKADVVAAVTETLREVGGGRSFIGGHPMAGSERSGVEAADAHLFQGATWMLTPTADVVATDFERLAAFLRSLGARVLAVDVALHDRLVAVASHLPQVLATTLMDEAAEAADTTGDAVLAITGGGFRDVTRIAGSDPDLWVGILQQNRTAVLDAIDGFSRRLQTLRASLDERRWDDVRDALDRGRRARHQLPTKERVGALIDLVVPVDDRPTVLADVTTILGEAGVNIEDLSMRHATDVQAGALVVAVDGHDAAERALRLLVDRGFPGHLEPR